MPNQTKMGFLRLKVKIPEIETFTYFEGYNHHFFPLSSYLSPISKHRVIECGKSLWESVLRREKAVRPRQAVCSGPTCDAQH